MAWCAEIETQVEAGQDKCFRYMYIICNCVKIMADVRDFAPSKVFKGRDNSPAGVVRLIL